MAIAQTGWSSDGNWFWDGARWNDALSADAQWRFDGSSWQPFKGQRTPMPAVPGPAPSPAPVPAPAPVAGLPDTSAMPSWVAASEIQRLESEKIERRLAEMLPPAPLPADRDWRRVGEFMQYTPTARTAPAFWKAGWSSALIYVFLLWFCSPVALIYVWMTEWRMVTKVYRTVICGIWTIGLFDYISTHYSFG